MIRNSDLKYWYNYMNKRFFKKKLPNIAVRFKEPYLRHSMAETVSDIKTHQSLEIRVAPYLKTQSRVAVMSLLHEMCHVSCNVKYKDFRVGHGPRFTKELESLCRKGAFTRVNGGLL